MYKINRYVDIIGELFFIKKLFLHCGVIPVEILINNEKNKGLEYYNYIKLTIDGLNHKIEGNSFISEIFRYLIFEDITLIEDYKLLKKEIIDISEKYIELTEDDKKRIEDMLFEYKKCYILTCESNPVYKNIDSFSNFNVKINLSDIKIKNVYKINNFSDDEIINLIHCRDIKTEILCMLEGKKFLSVINKFIKKDFSINYRKVDIIRKKFVDFIL